MPVAAKISRHFFKTDCTTVPRTGYSCQTTFCNHVKKVALGAINNPDASCLSLLLLYGIYINNLNSTSNY